MGQGLKGDILGHLDMKGRRQKEGSERVVSSKAGHGNDKKERE